MVGPAGANRRLFLLKIHALLEYAFSVCGMAFLSMYMASLGLGIEMFFAVSIISVATATISQNTVSRRSDVVGNRLPYMLWSKGFYAAAMLLVAHAPSIPSILAASAMSNLISGEMLSAAVVYELVDSKIATLDHASRALFNKSTEFAKYRVFGSLGWAFTAPVAGFAIETLNAAHGVPLLGYKVMFTVSAAGVLCLAAFLRAILSGYRGGPDGVPDPGHGPGPPAPRFRITLPYGMLLSTSVVFSIATAIQANAVAPYLKSGLGLDESFYGFMMFTWALTEVPLFFLSSHVTRIAGWRVLVVISYAFLLVKLGTYMLVITPAFWPAIMLVQALNPFGISFPAKTYAITNELARERKALGMSLYQTANSLGSFTGGLLGIAMSAFLAAAANTMAGYRAYFLTAFIIACVAIAAFVTMHVIDKARARATGRRLTR